MRLLLPVALLMAGMVMVLIVTPLQESALPFGAVLAAGSVFASLRFSPSVVDAVPPWRQEEARRNGARLLALCGALGVIVGFTGLFMRTSIPRVLSADASFLGLYDYTFGAAFGLAVGLLYPFVIRRLRMK